MKTNKKTVPVCSPKGFTLIELLVVVLIIGILVAVAVPQYQFAVAKARLSTYLPLMHTISQAEEIYYIQNGKYTINPTLLEITLPTQCTTFGGFYNEWQCGNDFLFDFGRTGNDSLGSVGINYCPRYNQSYATCNSKRDFGITYYWNHHSTKAGKKSCVVFNNSKLGARICNSLKLN